MAFSLLTNGLTAAGVVLATLALWRVARPRPLRWVAAVLGTYGLAALVHAALTGTPLRATLGGAGLFAVLPRVLQGTFLGAVVVLPLGWLVAVVRAGIPRLRGDSPRAAIYQAVALTLCLALVVVSFPRSGAPSWANATAGRPLTPAERVQQLDRSLRAIEDGEREAPRDRWDPDYVVSMVGRDPQRLFEWVRDNTYWIPYRGTLRGPVGVLMDRQGNGLDRALLLATLLEKAGHAVRLAHGQLSASDITALLSTVVPRRSFAFKPTVDAAAAPDLREVAASYELDHAAVQDRFAVIDAAGNQTLTELDQRVVDQSARLSAAVNRPRDSSDWSANLASAREALADHWWVQQQEAEAWTDWDLLEETGSGRPALTEPTATTTPGALPADLVHQLTIRVITERWTGVGSQESKILEYSLRPADMAGRPVVLQFWPGSWPSEVASDPDGPRGMKAAALEQTEWAAMLQVGGRPVSQAVITEAGSADSRPETANPFGGLAGSFSSTMKQGAPRSSSTSALTAAWIEYEITIPGQTGRIDRRVVFDVVGPAQRAARQGPTLPLDEAQRLTRSLSLMMRTEILPVNCALAPEFVSHLASESLRKNAPLLRALALEHLSRNEEATRKLLAEATPPVSPLDTLALLRAEWGRSAHRVFVSELNVLTRHRTPVPLSRGVALQEATDIVSNGLGVDLRESRPFAVRLERGVFDTNAEAVLGGAPDAENTANAFKDSKGWVVITAARRSPLERVALPDDVKRRMVDDLDRGFIIVAPGGSRVGAAEKFAGWWRIDPKNGNALGMDRQGWGASLTDRAVLTNLAVQFAKAFIFEDGLCMGFPQAVNALVALKEVVTEKAFGFRMVKPYDPSDLYDKTYHGCMISAIVAGFAATLPLLLMTLRARGRLARPAPSPPKQPQSPDAPKSITKPTEPPDVAPPACKAAPGEGESSVLNPEARSIEMEAHPPASEAQPAKTGPEAGVSGPPAWESNPLFQETDRLERDWINRLGVKTYGPQHDAPFTPEEFQQWLDYKRSMRAAYERQAAAATERYQAASRATEQAQAAEDAAFDEYQISKQKGAGPTVEQAAFEKFQAAQRARLKAGDDFLAPQRDYARASEELRKGRLREEYAQRMEGPNARLFQEQQRYNEATKAFDDWTKAHPDETASCSQAWFDRWKEWRAAARQFEKEGSNFYQESMFGNGSTGGFDRTMPQPVGGPNPSAPPPLGQSRPPASSPSGAPAAPVSQTQPQVGPSGNAPPAVVSQNPIQPQLSPFAKTLSGQIGVADALKVPK